MLFASWLAYDIRMYAIRIYGYVIHEFDPWFNYRATEYLDANGWKAFFHWFDYESWYPLGRPVGTTIYPGMQITSVCLKWLLNTFFSGSGGKLFISLNDVCCLVPAWFGVTATWFLGLFAAECSGSRSAGAAAALIMSIVPAHIMRSVAGGYDNESIAMTAMCMTFFLWVRALRPDPNAAPGTATKSSYIFGVLSGLAYIYMVAAWGGFVFVLNMVGLHAAFLVLVGRYSSSLHRAYTLFYVIGTFGAMHVPPVGWGPLKSMEQLAPLLVFLGFQVLEAVNYKRKKDGLTIEATIKYLVMLSIPFIALLFVVAGYLYSIGYFGPLTARVRGLFVKHTRTGNPLVDSVAEHQPGSTQAYQTYLHHVYYAAPIGFLISCLRLTDANLFLLCYAYTAYYFASKMSRLVILLGPVAAALGGVALGFAWDQLIVTSVMQLWEQYGGATGGADGGETADDKKKDVKKDAKGAKDKKKEVPTFGKQKGANKKRRSLVEEVSDFATTVQTAVVEAREGASSQLMAKGAAPVRLSIGAAMMLAFLGMSSSFYGYSHQFAERSSQPQIMYRGQLQNGQFVMVDDYREAYFWLRDHTAKDARVMAWWDYGYQIAGIAERTSIADGNTWNHEHIATLGRILTAPEEEAHSLARHIADYVLVWAGGGGDDLAKSPHLARIGNSVYPGHCSDPTCSMFGFHQDRSPTPMMANSLLYKLVMAGQNGARVNETYFEHKYTSKYGKVRIYKVRKVSKKSKDWIANPDNRVCDAPGSWYCVGQYPPALQDFVSKRRDFKQLEDFNVKQDAHSKKYQEEYMRRMGGGGGKQAPGKGEL